MFCSRLMRNGSASTNKPFGLLSSMVPAVMLLSLFLHFQLLTASLTSKQSFTTRSQSYASNTLTKKERNTTEKTNIPSALVKMGPNEAGTHASLKHHLKPQDTHLPPHGEMENGDDIVEQPRLRSRRGITAERRRLWPYGAIPYEIAEHLKKWSTNVTILAAMRIWENETCLTFIEREPKHRYYIVFTTLPCFCCSYVGREHEDFKQYLSLSAGCETLGDIIHIIGHAIGFWNENNRPDRDGFVTVIAKNLQSSLLSKRMSAKEINSRGEPYDYNSIMHGHKKRFSTNGGSLTIVPTDPDTSIGQRIKPSPGDIRQANMLYSCPSCGRTFLQSVGTFSPSQVQLSRPEGIRCRWRITGVSSEQIYLNFIRMDMLPAVKSPQSRAQKRTKGQPLKLNSNISDECTEEFLEVYDGYYHNSLLLGRYCGTNLPPQLVSSSSSMLIDYIRPPGSKGSGFAAEYKAVCGGEMKGNNGTFTSPQFPMFFVGNLECRWSIEVPVESVVLLTFKTFNLGRYKHCRFENIEIYDGPSTNSKLIQTLCGSDMPQPVTSTSNKMYVKFISSFGMAFNGFFASFQGVNRKCHSAGCQHHCVRTADVYKCECREEYELDSDGKTCKPICGGYRKANIGIITSPNYPDKYPDNLECLWTIEAPAQSFIILTFKDFSIAGERDCNKDYVEIYDGPSTDSRLLEQLCMDVKPQPIKTTANKMHMKFISDSLHASKGFYAFFESVHKDCQYIEHDCQHRCVDTLDGYKCDCLEDYELQSDGKTCKVSASNLLKVNQSAPVVPRG